MSWLLSLSLLMATPPPSKTERETMVEDARVVLGAIVTAARANHKADVPEKDGDRLTALYLRHAASAAEQLPAARRGRAFSLAVGVGLDTAATLRTNLLTRTLWKRLESDDERNARLKVLGRPSLHGRHDLAQHWAVSAALTAASGSKASQAAGILKELLDSEAGGSGFSFADLAADLAGIALASRVIEEPKHLAPIAKEFRSADYCPSPKGLLEGLTRAEFEKRFGGIDDERFLAEVEKLQKAVQRLPTFRDTKP